MRLLIGHDKRGYLSVNILGIETTGLLDSGASRSVVGKEGWNVLQAAGIEVQPSQKYKFISVANKGVAKIAGEAFVPFEVGGLTRIVRVLYVPQLSSPLILGIDFWRRFHLRPDFLQETCDIGEIVIVPEEYQEETSKEDVLTADQRRELQCIVEHFKPKLDTGTLGCLKGVSHHIDTGDAPPCKQRYNSLNPKIMSHVLRELEERLDMGIIEPSESPYSSPLLLIPKKDKGWRWVVDFRQLNESILKPSAHPLPKIDPMLWNVKGGAIFSSIDVKDAYLQIPLDKESRAKTAFTVPGRGLFQYTRLPAGLKDAAARWQSAIEKVLGNDPHVLVYMDDILLWSPAGNWNHHKELVRKVLQKLADAGLTIKMDKCVFGREKTKYLGHVIDKFGIRPDPSKIAAVVNFPRPNNVKKVRQFLGLAGWMRKFIQNFSIVSCPLYRLLKKDTRFQWTEEENAAFIQLKEMLCRDPILRSPDFNLTFKVYTDASAVGTGAILTQEFSDGEHVVAYSSKSLKGREVKYSATELECLAVLHALQSFRPYIEGYQFELITDHSSLQWLHKLKNPSGRLSRWAVQIQQYDAKIVHRKGSAMAAPDALSRNPPDITCSVIEVSTDISDEWYLELKNKVCQSPEEYPQFAVKDDLLFKLITVGPMIPQRWVQVIPSEKRRLMLEKSHSEPTSGHGGVFRTFQRLRLQGYWPKMQRDVVDFVKKCHICQQVKSERQAPAGLMGTSLTISAPFEVLSTDLIGPLPRSSDGHTFLSVTTDHFSKFVFLKPLRSATAEAVCKHIKNDIFLVHGAPRLILADNGKQYRSIEFQEMCKQFNVSVKYNIPYNPRSNPTERTNQTIGCMLRAYVDDKQKKWDKYLPELQFALRSSVSSVTGYSPQMLVYGREVDTDGRHHLLTVPEDLQQIPDSEPRANHACSFRRLQLVQDEVNARLLEAQKRGAHQYNLRRRQPSFQVGDQVLKRNFVKSDKTKGFSKKLAEKWTGPFKIKQKIGMATYLLDGGDENVTCHADQMKKYFT